MPLEPPTVPRLHVDDDRILGGVAGHLARSLGVDALWVRLGFVLLALVGGIGILLYAGLWLVTTSPGGVRRWQWRRILGGSILVGAVPLVLVAQIGTYLSGPFAVVLLLAGLAVALWRGPAVAGARADAENIAPAFAPPEVGADRTGPSEPQGPRRPRAEPSLLGRTALGVAIAVAAVGALVDQANGGRLHPEQWLGAAAAVCGLGLLVGTVRGQGRWLIVPAAFFAAAGYVVGTAAALGINTADGFGRFGTQWMWIGDGSTSSQRTVRSMFGDVEIQVQGLPLDRATVVVDARVAFGDVVIRSDGRVPIEVRVRGGDGVTQDGRDLGRQPVVHIGPAGEPLVVVDARISHGRVRVVGQPGFVPVEPVITLPGPPTAGATIPVVEGVTATTDGWFVLGGGEAVIDDQDRLVSGAPDVGGEGWIPTAIGEFRLLPRGLLLTPLGEIVDLRAVRARLSGLPPNLVPPSTPATTTFHGVTARPDLGG